MTSMGVLMITLSVVGVSWLDKLNADTNRCVSAYYDRHHAISFFGDHSDWKYDKHEESYEDYGEKYVKTSQCVRVRDRELTDTESNNDLNEDIRNDINKNNHQPQKSTSSIKFKGSKSKRKKEKKKKRRRKKKKNVNN